MADPGRFFGEAGLLGELGRESLPLAFMVECMFRNGLIDGIESDAIDQYKGRIDDYMIIH